MNNSKCSLTVSRSKRTLCCGQSPKLSRIDSMSVSILFPLTCAEPEEGGKRPVRMDIVVVFPAPLWPSNAVIWPLYIWSDSPSTATLEPVEPCKESHTSMSLFLFKDVTQALVTKMAQKVCGSNTQNKFHHNNKNRKTDDHARIKCTYLENFAKVLDRNTNWQVMSFILNVWIVPSVHWSHLLKLNLCPTPG